MGKKKQKPLKVRNQLALWGWQRFANAKYRSKNKKAEASAKACRQKKFEDQ